MKREIALERVCGRTRLAVLEDGRLCEIVFGTQEKGGLTGGIYAGCVRNILPGMNAAFVDIGLNKNAYLAANDAGVCARGEAALTESLRAARIETLLRPGEIIVCQVVKEPGGAKGPRISLNVTLPGRNIVLLPKLRYAGVSKKIGASEKRARLHAAAQEIVRTMETGVIVRTAGSEASPEELRAEAEALLEQWRRVETAAKTSSVPRRIETEVSFAEAAVRDYLNAETDSMRTDDPGLCAELIAAAEKYAPALRDRISRTAFEAPLFDLLRVDHQLREAFERRVDLKSGGTIVIDETEAMTVIDVNTGRFVGQADLEETVFRLNCEAAAEIARQVRLREIGGIIIVDFIDMTKPENREALLKCLREAFARDHSHANVLGMTELGLVQITRRKARKPLSRLMTCECPLCKGGGHVPAPETMAFDAVRELWRRRRFGDVTPYRIIADERTLACVREMGFDDANARLEASRRIGWEIVPDDRKGDTV